MHRTTPNQRLKLQNHKVLTHLLCRRITRETIRNNTVRIERNRSLKIEFLVRFRIDFSDIRVAIWRVRLAWNMKPKTVPENPWNVVDVSILNRPKQRSEEGGKGRWTKVVTVTQSKFLNFKSQIEGLNLNKTWNKLEIWKAHEESYEMDY